MELHEAAAAAEERAKLYLRTKARPLEKAMYAYEFEGGRAEDVVRELEPYQNEDGGFGHGLEPDIRCEASSAIATTVALQTLALLPRETGEEMTRKALRYFTQTYDPAISGWEIVPPEVEHAPRAPWWNYSEASPYWGNPSAEIAGYFIQFREWPEAEGWADKLTELAIGKLCSESPLDEFHELLCYLRLSERLTGEQRARIADPLDTMIARCVTADPAQWSGYGLHPVQVETTRQSPYYERYKEIIPANLEFIVRGQTEEGAWEPAWAWGQYEDVWPIAKEAWKSVLTLGNLRLLRDLR
ncbi:hypothetical protein [Paenibacillus ehimensis]|uniref:hypothetical protein n=1 Tax=Paenibacillus ehimensis TaxID=79264 RepID=UPI0004718093|nr:hypothetical protein [Paenibacillus ehimensis]